MFCSVICFYFIFGSISQPSINLAMRSTGRFLARSFATSARKDHVKILADHWSPAVPRSPKGNNIVVETASGVWVTDITGRKYLDMMTGIGVTSTGHCHPRYGVVPYATVP